MRWTPNRSGKSFVCGTDCAVSKGKGARRSRFGDRSRKRWQRESLMQLDYVRSEIERMRAQVQRQRGEIRQLQRAGISTAPAEALLERMLIKIDELCTERD